MDEEYHTCHFCGEYVKDGKDAKGNRHWLSDCRPDLVAHEPGETCTWHNLETTGPDCYAYSYNNYAYLVNGGPPVVWTDEHKYFHEDGPM